MTHPDTPVPSGERFSIPLIEKTLTGYKAAIVEALKNKPSLSSRFDAALDAYNSALDSVKSHDDVEGIWTVNKARGKAIDMIRVIFQNMDFSSDNEDINPGLDLMEDLTGYLGRHGIEREIAKQLIIDAQIGNEGRSLSQPSVANALQEDDIAKNLSEAMQACVELGLTSNRYITLPQDIEVVERMRIAVDAANLHSEDQDRTDAFMSEIKRITPAGINNDLVLTWIALAQMGQGRHSSRLDRLIN